MNVEELIGKTITNINTADEVVLRCSDNSFYRFHHEQDCCESVGFVGYKDEKQPIVPFTISNVYETSTSWEDDYESHTEQEFALETNKGIFVLMFRGDSNGYYGEDVYLQKLTEKEWKTFE